ncbi:MAG TPA: DUF2947 family protein [Chitinophagales bacterium]|nr:DUF2947 family protein [Chitinophagales bacterium]
MSKQNILESVLGWGFEGGHPQHTFLLSAQEANKLWAEKIDRHNFHYFKLGDDVWVTQTDTLLTNNWVECYNNEQSEETTNTLSAFEEWHDTDTIYFCRNGSIIIESTWAEFKNYWRCFLSIYDDCPIILNAAVPHVALIFSARGAIFIARQ